MPTHKAFVLRQAVEGKHAPRTELQLAFEFSRLERATRIIEPEKGGGGNLKPGPEPAPDSFVVTPSMGSMVAASGAPDAGDAITIL